MEHLKNKPSAVDDALKLPKNDAFEKALNALFDGEQNGEPYLIALLDVDCFLHVNTDFGRDVGDRVLIETGKYLKDSLPACAELYRIAGDEFGILFRAELEKEDVFLLLEKIRSNYAVSLPDRSVMTMSVGIAAAFDDASRTPELIRKAESAMFRAKLSGRNRVALAREEKMITKTSHYTNDQLQRLTKLSKREGIGEAILLREALDMLLKKYEM